MTRGWTTQLLTGLAEYLANGGVGVWHDPDGVLEPYAAGETAIVLGAMPPEPERAIVLASYPVAEDLVQADVTVGVQVRIRAGADPRDVQDSDDQVFDLLHGMEQCTVGGISIVQCYRRSSAGLGQARDSTARWERVSNYYVDAMRPTAARPY